ncbi:hypothetical protein TWF696_007448 [Orbilia brochopaga]|uniref:Carboxylesterase type B domain-containing protein n=1 Tax=Orbilia brochopaga TaxID=3140254 RepID=A0AAV9UKI7_9PEZI
MLRHPTLGKLRGLESPLTIQYRNLPYAQFNGRFREASIRDDPVSVDDAVYDATQWGPLCPQIPDGINFDFALAGAELPYTKRRIDEEHGLNAVVTVPKKHADGKLLPVLVWVHGSSGFRRALGETCYRLGILGLLASKELNSGGNFGLKDQILGFQWLQKHISGFGGDPNNITAFGESAGAMLLSTLLQLPTPLFKKAMVMSGSATLRPSKTEKQQEALYNDVVSALDLTEKSSEERKMLLYEIPYEDMIAKLPPLIHVGPSVESRFLDDVVTLSTLSKSTSPSWCTEIVIGDCFHDATCFKTRILNKPNNAEYFIGCINSVLVPEQAQNVIHAYSLSPLDSAETSLVKCIELLTDLRWYLPILYIDIGLEKTARAPKVSRYHFHQPNKFDCQWNGLAAHLFDITLLLQNHRHLLGQDAIRLGEEMADRVFSLAYGSGFVSKHEDDGSGNTVVVWGPDGASKLLRREEYDAELRRGRGMVLLGLGPDVCERLAGTIQFGSSR